MVHAFNTEATPIKRAPNEILSEIFLYCAPSKEQPPAGTILTWLSITHVCQRWRAVTLAHSAFWATITCLSAPLTELMLRRSRNTIVSVTYRGHGDRDEEFITNFQVVEQHLHRVRDFDLVCRQLSYRTLIHTCVSELTPKLETLSLSCLDGPPPFFYPDLPLASPPFHPSPAPGARLRELRLSGFAFPIAIRDMNALIDAFQRMPNLTTMNIDWAPPRRHLVFVPPTEPTQPTASLPRLHSLRLVGIITHCAYFLRRLTPSATAALNIHCMHDPALEDWTSAYENFTGALHTLTRDRPPFTTLVLELDTISTTLHAGYERAATPAGADAPADLTLHLHAPPRALVGFDICTFTAGTRDALPCREARVLAVQTRMVLPTTWWRTFADFARVERVKLTHTGAASGFVALFGGRAPEDDGFMRGVRTLALCRVDMAAQVTLSGRTGRPVSVYGALVRGCRVRRGVMKMVQASRCQVHRVMMKGLSRHVETVQWDEDEGIDWFQW